MSLENEEVGMSQRQRKHIINNKDKLIRVTKYNELMDFCVRTNLLSPIMRENIENSQGNMHEQLLIKITKRGPEAFGILRRIFEEMKNTDALNILDDLDGGGDDAAFQSIHNNKRNKVLRTQISSDGGVLSAISSFLQQKMECPDLAPCNVMVESKYKVIKSHHIMKGHIVPIYPMKTKNRGVIFITNIIEATGAKKRNGAEYDSPSLIDLFRQLGFTVYHYFNLKEYQFFKLLKELLESENVRQTESFVLALMTHGNVFDNVAKVIFNDGKLVEVKKILDLFQHSSCPSLIHKPKIMLLPFCRGDEPDFGFKFNPKHLETDCIKNTCVQHTSSRSDTIICHASLLGFEAHRTIYMGNWYIQVFCKQMAKHAHHLDFESILKLVNEEVSQMRSEFGSLQTSSYINEGFKNLYFNPGL